MNEKQGEVDSEGLIKYDCLFFVYRVPPSDVSKGVAVASKGQATPHASMNVNIEMHIYTNIYTRQSQKN